MLRLYIEKLMEGLDLTIEESKDAIDSLINGADSHQAAALLALLHSKGETPSELAGMAKSINEHALKIECDYPVLDIVGTGGDNASTVNISTGAAIVAATTGAKVAKHGNRSVSSRCGSADILEKLGVNIELGSKGVKECLDKLGIGFMYAPIFHPSWKAIAPIRKALKIRTAFNILGPLVNPADADHMLIGVYTEELLDLMAQTLFELKTKRSLIVHSVGLDELTLAAPTEAREVLEDGIREVIIDPLELGLNRAPIEALKGGEPSLNCEILTKALKGEESPVLDTLALNAGVALDVFGHVKSLQEGVELSREVLLTGKAFELLDSWAKLSQSLKKGE